MGNRVRELLEEFASKLEEVLKADLRAAIDGVGLGTKSADRPFSAASNSRRAAGRGRGVKRDAASLDALAERFTSFVAKNPGLRIEQINKELGTTTKDLALPIRKLIADGQVKTSGQKRSTTYSVAGGARKSTGAKRRKK